MALKRLKKNDTVMIIAGRERGKTGKVLRVLPDEGRVLIERMNLVKRHMKPRGQQQAGGIIDKEASLHLSNVLPVCGRCSKPTRVGRKRLDDGKAVRICRRCGEQMETT